MSAQDLSGGSGDEHRFEVEIPAGAGQVRVVLYGGNGDADLYTGSSAPSTSEFGCRPFLQGNYEVCTVDVDEAVTLHVLVHGYSAFSDTNVAVIRGF